MDIGTQKKENIINFTDHHPFFFFPIIIIIIIFLSSVGVWKGTLLFFAEPDCYMVSHHLLLQGPLHRTKQHRLGTQRDSGYLV